MDEKVLYQMARAIGNYVYFQYSFYPKSTIYQCWADSKITADHLYGKLKEYDYDLNKFFVNLDTTNQLKFAKWIAQNFNGAPRWTIDNAQ